VSGSALRAAVSDWQRSDEYFRGSGTGGSNPVPSSGESVSVVNCGRCRPKARHSRRSTGGLGREKARAGCKAVLLGRFFLSGIAAVPPQKTQTFCNDPQAAVRGPGMPVRCGLVCEQYVLLGPVQRQIELTQTRRGEPDRLLAFEDRLDQPRAQERQADEA